MGQNRGYAIMETVSALAFEKHLRLLAKERDKRMKRRMQKNSPPAKAERTKNEINTNTNDSIKGCECQALLSTEEIAT